MKRRLLSMFCALALCLSLLPATALAADAVSYVEYSWNGSKLTEEATTPVTDYTTLSGNINNTTWGAGWYMVSGTVTVNNNRDSTVTVSGTVNLILPQGSKLDLSYGTIIISDGGTLNIYGQETGSGTLTLGGNHRDANPGIGLGSGSTLNIHGGTVNATGYCTNATSPAPGIDVGGSGTLTVYDGTVTATGGTASNSIGRGAGIRVISGGTVNIHGGTVTATGASNKSALGVSGAGIGGNGGSSAGETCGNVTITGGTVTATGGSGGSGASAGIGGGQGGTAGSQGGGGNVTITGGTVTAIGGESTAGNAQAPGIGGAVYNNKGNAGSFSTGTGGSAVITTTGGIQDETSKNSWQGIIDGTVYGTVTLPDSQLSGKTLTVSENANLTIPDGAALTGSITVESGGTLTVNSGSTVTNSGTITNNGTLTGGGTINNTGNGKVTGEGTNNTVTITYPSTVTVTSNQSNDTVGPNQEVTFTATVTGSDTVGTPTGTVQFKDNGNDLGTAQTLNNEGKATYTTSNLEIGEHKITAVYSGDGSYTAKTSSELTFTVVGDVASISIETQPKKMTYTTGETLDLTGLVITLHYDGTDYTSEVSWGTDSGITSDPENGTELQASEHNDKAVTITYGGKTATTDALTVNKADQTGFGFTESSITKTYGDESFTVEATGGQSTGDVTYAVTSGGDVISISDNTVTILKAGEATITATKAADGDYNEATATLTVTVSKASQTGFAFTESSPKTVTYGEGTFTVTAEGGPGSGDVTYEVTEGTDIISISDDTVTILKAGEATITATKAEDDNYSETTATLTVTVSKAPLTITGVTATSRDYNGSNTVAITGVTLDGVFGQDEVSVDTSGLTGTVDSPDVGTYNTLTLSGTVTLTGAAAGNYTLTLPTEPVTVTGGVTIRQATASISFNNYAPGKTYDGTALANPTESELTLTGAGYNDVTFTWYEGTSPDGAKLDSAPTDAGTYYLVASIPGSANTIAASTTSGAITISPAEISIQSATLKTKTYDGTTAATVESVTFSGTTQPAETDYTVTAAAFADKTAGDSKTGGTVTVKLTSGNFTFAGNQDEATYASATGTINKLPVVLEWSTPTEFTYDGQEKTVTAKITNVVGDDDVTLTYDNNAKTDAGSYTATVTGLGNDNYTLDGVENASLTWHIAGVSIDGAVVTLTPESSTYTGSEQRPTVTVTLDSQDLDGDTDYEVSYDPAEVKNAGTYTVTVTGTGNYEGTATATFTIQKADPNIGAVTYSGGDLYDSTALDSITLNRGNSDIDGTLKLDAGQTLKAGTYDYSWTFTPAEAVNYETVTGTVELTVKADTLKSVSVKSGPTKTEYVYGDFFDTTGLVLEATYASNNKKEISADEITVETTGPLTCDMTAVTVSYQGKTCTVTVTVGKATYSGQTTVTGTIWANTASEVQLPQPPDGATFGNPVYSIDSDTVVRVEITGNTLAYEGGSGVTKGQEYEITIPVDGGTNYNNYQITVTLTGTDKKVPTGAPTLSTDTITYGQPISTITLSGSMQDGAETVTGTFTWDAPTTTPDAGSYEAHWTFTPADGNLYVSVSGTTTITVNKATPTGTPKYTAITTSGKTLADAGLTTEGGTFSVPGTVAWEQADTTQVQANTAYTWKFTPTDSDNYNSISGSITLYVVSSSGGGGGSSGGGSSSSGSQTETTTNPDGSTTTTVTSSNGTVTETTKNPDGSQKVVETKKDGTVTTTTTDTTGNKTQVVENTDGTKETTITNKDGSGSATTVDETGKTQAEVKLPAAVVEDAQGEAVALPMPEVPVTADKENAPTVTVDLPVGGSVKVEIPVEDVTPGTVAVIVKADGTEEVIKTSLTTENGVAVTLSDGDTVKVVDNSKTFDDVADNYWGAEAVDFAVSRELFAGTSATTFAPDTAMTRAMIVTVLARFEGVDTTSGSTWYEAGQQWAVANGVSDGTNMDASLTREHLATMLWRYAGSPSVSNDLSNYTDAGTVSSYAQQAMAWCVEQGIIGGTTTTTLSPQGPATRAQVATILMRFIEGMA